jgi:predicted LPLAT superfamily acyltransferase
MDFRPCAIVPVYNHPERLAGVVSHLRRLDLPVILVDDGSEATGASQVAAVAAGDEQVYLLRHERNLGKGAAVETALKAAREDRFTHALQVDADGQHDLGDVPALLRAARTAPASLVSGRPLYDDTVPRSRLIARYITHVWVWIETLSLRLKDSMCGLRVYPVEATLAVLEEEGAGARMEFDTEIMVRLYWRGHPVRFLPTRVTYHGDGSSHFRLLRDNLRISWMHARLFAGMLRRLPRLLFRRRPRPESHWSRQPERGTPLGLRLTLGVYRLIGHRGARVLLYGVAAYFLLVHGRARRASIRYQARLQARFPGRTDLPRPGWRGAWRHFRQFAHANVDRLRAWAGEPLDERVLLPDDEQLEALLGSDRGALLVSAHLGNLEFCRALAQRRSDLRINALVYTRNARKYNNTMRSLNERYGTRLLLVDQVGPDTAMMLRERVADRELVAIVGDRTPVDPGSPMVEAPFLGHTATFAAGPWILAHILECPVYLLFCVEEAGGEYRILLERFADRVRLPRRDRRAALAGLAARYAHQLESVVKRYPLQWYNFFDFWRNERVAGAPAAHPERYAP